MSVHSVVAAMLHTNALILLVPVDCSSMYSPQGSSAPPLPESFAFTGYKNYWTVRTSLEIRSVWYWSSFTNCGQEDQVQISSVICWRRRHLNFISQEWLGCYRGSLSAWTVSIRRSPITFYRKLFLCVMVQMKFHYPFGLIWVSSRYWCSHCTLFSLSEDHKVAKVTNSSNPGTHSAGFFFHSTDFKPKTPISKCIKTAD